MSVEARRFYDFWRLTKFRAPRDQVFQMVMDGFMTAPVRMLDIGGVKLDAPKMTTRYSEGWAAFFWSQYILTNGGSLHVAVIDPAIADDTRRALAWFDGKIGLRIDVASGMDALRRDNGYNLVHVDGGCNLDEVFGLCHPEAVVLCDDFSKGEASSHPNHILLKFTSGHGMALYYPGSTPVTVDVEETPDMARWRNSCFLDNFDDPKTIDHLKGGK